MSPWRRRRRSPPCSVWAAGSVAAGSSTTCWVRPRMLLLRRPRFRRSASGANYSAAGWRDLLDQLQFEGLLREDHNDGRPLIGLGEAAGVRAVYRGERRVSMRQMTAGGETAGRTGRARKRHGGERAGVEAADASLFEALRAWRRERAAEQRVPPYVIFHDTTLSAIARKRPASLDDLSKVSGVGQSKLKRYGAMRRRTDASHNPDD